jgi:hypothetical protein
MSSPRFGRQSSSADASQSNHICVDALFRRLTFIACLLYSKYAIQSVPVLR